MPTAGASGPNPTGRASIAFLNGHAESAIYPSKTDGRALFSDVDQLHEWRESAPPDKADISTLVMRLDGPCPGRKSD